MGSSQAKPFELKTSSKEELTIPEYPYIQTRLQPIDWQQVIKNNDGFFNDPNFRPHRDSIVDPMIQREKRI